MQPKPPDLTKIAARSGGTFSDEVVFRTIDGRSPKAGHGGQGMPVWGDAFGRRGQTPEDTRRRVDAVVQYLRSIQGKERPRTLSVRPGLSRPLATSRVGVYSSTLDLRRLSLSTPSTWRRKPPRCARWLKARDHLEPRRRVVHRRAA